MTSSSSTVVDEAAITRTELDGVPVFCAPEEGLLRALLLFRAGKIDETLPSNGISHLVEHLTLTGVGQQPYEYNGFVEGLLTGFVVAGSPDEVVEFYQRVCAGLTQPPLERVEQEARILQTEGAGRKSGPIDAVLAVRFGARGWGLVNYPEYGLKLPPSAVSEWGRQLFTRENAALALTGPVPDGLRLPLATGDRRPVPPLTVPRYPLPAWMSMNTSGVGVAMLAERSTPLLAILHIAERRAQARLRYQDAISYQVGVNYMRVNGTTAHFTLFADSLPDQAPKVRDGILAVIEELADSGPSDDDVRTELELARRSFQQPDRVITRLQAAVAAELYGAPTQRREEIIAELESVTTTELASALREAIGSAIVVVPNGVSVDDKRFQPVPEWSRDRLYGRGRRLRHFAGARPTRLILASEGVTMFFQAARFVTIRYSELAGVLQWTDGSRTLLADNGSRIHARPDDWRGGKAAIEEIDQHVPKDLVIAMGDRPSPDPWRMVNPLPTSTRVRRAILAVVVGFFWILVLWFGLSALLGTGGSDAASAAVGYAVLAVIFSIPLALPYIRQFTSGRREAKPGNQPRGPA